jgi:Holin of 3TMs, for gene-transfer release
MGLDITGLGSVADLVGGVLDKIFPDKTKAAEAKAALMQAQLAGDLKTIDDQYQIQIEQIKANAAAEAKPGLSFRDGAGWVCVTGFAVTILKPLIEWGCALAGHSISLPSVDTSTITTMLFALLGIGGMHVYEKTQK